MNNADKRIAELMRDGLELIEDVRVASDRHEVERRVAEADIKESKRPAAEKDIFTMLPPSFLFSFVH